MSEKKKASCLKILGMMSGTSGDGIDGALVQFNDDGSFVQLWHDSERFSEDARLRIKNLMIEASAAEVILGGSYIAEKYADALQKFLQRNSERPDYIAAHGQTILHLPQQTDWEGFKLSGSLQLMNGSLLAQRTNIPVICNFREADMAVGGQGAPLVPFADACFFGKDIEADRIILNVGGIANITVLKKAENQVKVACAFDTGPGNMLMDAFCELSSAGSITFDQGGVLASSGKIFAAKVGEFLADPYFAEVPPKSTGREKFGVFKLRELMASFPKEASNSDILSTLLEMTVKSIADAILSDYSQVCFPAELIIAGGGALNCELVRRLKKKLDGKCQVFLSEDFKIPVMGREAMAFAALGNAFIRGIPANAPNATGASKKVILGELHPI